MKVLNTALVKLTLFLMAGIFAGFNFPAPLSLLLLILGLAGVLFLISYFLSHRQLLQQPWFGSSCYFLFFLLGFLTTQLHLPEKQPQHYSNLINEGSSYLQVHITEELKPGLYQEKYLAEVMQLNGKPSHGKLLLQFEKDSVPVQLDEELRIFTELKPIPTSLNPQQFDYRQFMKNRGILFLASPDKEEIIAQVAGPSSIKGRAQQFRSEVTEKLRQNGFEKEELSIIQALLLGQRQDISEETYNSYAAAGVIHILAVSGLHVGILLLILNWLLSPLKNLRYGGLLKIILLLVLLWAFAVVAGLSPSVVRAVTMFSFVAVGMQLKRQTSIISTLFMSLMLLLLVRPQLMFEVGFQLSYSAVFSIVLLQPPLYQLFRSRIRAVRYFWGLLTVTLAAQIGVLPLSLFYFHQFPGLFFISNLVILPFLGVILMAGIVVIALALADLLPELLVKSYGSVIESLNSFVYWVARQESFLLVEIPFSQLLLVCFYAFIFGLLYFVRQLDYRSLMAVLLGLILVQGAFLYENLTEGSPELVVFHKSRYTVIVEGGQREVRLSHNLTENPEQQSYVKNYFLTRRPEHIELQGLKNYYLFKDAGLLVIDSTALYLLSDTGTDLILLTSSPKLNLERLIKDLQPREIIADASNYRSYVQRWKETCRKQKIPFHYTGEKGAYILK